MHVILRTHGNVLEIYGEFSKKDSASCCSDFYGEMYAMYGNNTKRYTNMNEKWISCN